MKRGKVNNEAALFFDDEVGEELKVVHPPGHARAEQRKKRQDVLEQQAEELSEQEERYSIPEEALRPDHDLQSLIVEYDMLEVSNPQPGWVYCFACTRMDGLGIQKKKAMGWLVVQGDDPECRELKKEDTTRRIGDALLMKLPLARKKLFDQRHEYLNAMREQSLIQGVEALAEKYPRAVKLNRDLSTISLGGRPLDEIMARKATTRKMMRQQAMPAIDRMIRNGQVPGMPTPGRR